MQLGPYRLLERIGAGGMGEVWKAEDTHLLRTVAIKLLRAEMAGDEWKARFLREARTAARLSHANIATIYAVDEADQQMYIAMEYVEGDSLKKLIASRTLTAPDVVHIVKRCADALSEAHLHGIIHRDVKPENIVVTSRRVVKMLDFGIAKLIDAPSEDAGKLTSDGTVIGTPEYMSPEQALGRTIDPRSDIFSLGVVLFEALTNRHPFAGSSVTETLVNLVTHEAPAIVTLLPDVSPRLAEIVRKSMQKKPEDRYEGAKQMASALNKVYPSSSSAFFPAVKPGDSPTVPIAPTPAPKPKAKSSAKWKAVGADTRVLVADDDPEVRRQLGEALKQHRLECDEAANGSEAIQQLKRRKYALAFIDLVMPRVDGWAVIDFIRSHAEHRETKTYVVAAGEQRLSTVDQDVIAGIVSKPFDPAKLDSLLQSFVSSQRQS